MFTADPSVVGHNAMADFAQKLNVLTQKFPFISLQAPALPHAQATEFFTDPSMLEQESPRLQVLVDMSQYKPVLSEHADVPHKHGEGFDVEPPVLSHAGAEKQMQ